MLFLVRMRVSWPAGLPAAEAEALKAREKAYCQDLQRRGVWRHLWREAGQFGNVSVFEVADADALHDALSGLPFFDFLTLEVTALAAHPSAL